MKLKIISDGTAWGTRVVNAETGEQIEYVSTINWFWEPKDWGARATIEVVNVEVDLEVDGRLLNDVDATLHMKAYQLQEENKRLRATLATFQVTGGIGNHPKEDGGAGG